MAAVCVYPMCVRLSRGLLRFRSKASAAGLVRNLSAEPGKGKESGATEGLFTEAILQKKLQQQQEQEGSQSQPPPTGEGSGEQQDDQQKQKENTARVKKLVFSMAGIMGLTGAVTVVYIFGSNSVDEHGNKALELIRSPQELCDGGTLPHLVSISGLSVFRTSAGSLDFV